MLQGDPFVAVHTRQPVAATRREPVLSRRIRRRRRAWSSAASPRCLSPGCRAVRRYTRDRPPTGPVGADDAPGHWRSTRNGSATWSTRPANTANRSSSPTTESSKWPCCSGPTDNRRSDGVRHAAGSALQVRAAHGGHRRSARQVAVPRGSARARSRATPRSASCMARPFDGVRVRPASPVPVPHASPSDRGRGSAPPRPRRRSSLTDLTKVRSRGHHHEGEPP